MAKPAIHPNSHSGQEVWWPIPEYEGCYEVSTDGRVRSLDREVLRGGFPMNLRGRMLKQNKNGSGYCQVVLSGPKGQWNAFVHRLVALTFLGDPMDGQEVRHMDGCKNNNTLSNLKWGTKSENMSDCKRHGTSGLGERNGSARLTADDVLSIRRDFSQGKTRDNIAQRLGIAKSHVCQIVNGESWRHIGGPITDKITDNRTSPKLTRSDVFEIRAEYERGVTQQVLADKYGVSRPTISMAVTGRTWADLV